jgi:hypothetical protein
MFTVARHWPVFWRIQSTLSNGTLISDVTYLKWLVIIILRRQFLKPLRPEFADNLSWQIAYCRFYKGILFKLCGSVMKFIPCPKIFFCFPKHRDCLCNPPSYLFNWCSVFLSPQVRQAELKACNSPPPFDEGKNELSYNSAFMVRTRPAWHYRMFQGILKST